MTTGVKVRNPLLRWPPRLRGSIFGRAWWIVPLLGVAIWLRWSGMNKSFHEDELFDLYHSAHSYKYPQKLLLLGKCLLGFCSALAESGQIWIVRLPVLFGPGLLSIFLGWQLGRTMRNWVMGALLAVGLTIWPFKAYWDIMVRDYAIAMCMMMALLVLMESLRRHPAWWKIALLIPVYPWALLAHEITPVLAPIPVFYLIWYGLNWSWKAWVGKKRRQPGWVRQRAVRWGGILVALAIGLALTAAGLLERKNPATHMMGGAEFAAASAEFDPMQWGVDRIAPSKFEFNWDILQRKPVIPPAPEIFGYLKGSFETGLRNDPPKAAPLLGFETESRQKDLQGLARLLFGESLVGYRQGFKLHEHENLSRLLLGLMLIGSLIVAWRSPPLLLSLWCIILGVSWFFHFNPHYTQPTARYYLMPWMCVMIMSAHAGAFFIRLPARAVGLWRARWGAALLALTVLGLGVYAICLTQAQTRRANAFVMGDWNALMESAHSAFPEGALALGVGDLYVDYHKRLTVARERHMESPPGYWTSRERMSVYQAYPKSVMHDETFLDRWNHHAGAVLFQPNSWPYRVQAIWLMKDAVPYNPNVRLSKDSANSWAVHPFGRRLFIMHGRETVPLMPRLIVGSQDGATQFHIETHYEVPGNYRVAVGLPEGAEVASVTVGGRAVEYATGDPETQPDPGEGAIQAVLRESMAQPPALGRAEAVLAARSGLHPHWFRGPGEPPLLLEPARESQFTVKTPATPYRRQLIELSIEGFDAAGPRPLIRWAYAGDNWTTFTETFDRQFKVDQTVADKVSFEVPLRLRKVEPDVYQCGLFLIDRAKLEVVLHYTLGVDMSVRALRPGDTLMIGPMVIDQAKMRELKGRTLKLALQSNRRPAHLKDEEYREEPPYIPDGDLSKSLVLGFVRFVEVDGGMRMQFGQIQ